MTKNSDMNEHNTLIVLDKARKLLAEAKTYDEAATIRGQAEALRAYCQQQKLSIDCYNYAAEIKLRAERKMGGFLASLKKNRGGQHCHKKSTGRGESTGAPTLKNLGVTKDASARYQRLARVPEALFADAVKEITEASEPLTTQSVLREAEGQWLPRPPNRKSERSAATTASPDGMIVIPVSLLLNEAQEEPFLEAMEILGDRANQLIFDSVIATAKKRPLNVVSKVHSRKTQA
jgi:hypothetical protein